MADTYSLMRALIESRPRAAKSSKWRPPGETQLDLEKSLTRAIKQFILSAKLTRSDVTMPNEQAHDKLLDTITNCLEKAVHEGKLIATGRHERGIINAAKNVAGRAVQLISDIVGTLQDKARGIIEALFGSGDTEATIADAESQLEQWAESYAEGVAENEIQMAVVGATVDAYRDDGVMRLDIVLNPGACEVCRAIVRAHPIVSIEDGEKLPPYHFECRCGAIEHEGDVLTRHYPHGKDHDQSNHGNRYGTDADGNKVLVYKGGSGPKGGGKGSKSGGSTKSVKSSEPLIGADGFPTHEALKNAQLNQFGNSLNLTYKTNIDGKDFFVKTSRTAGNAPLSDEENQRETDIWKIGQMTGVEDHLVPVKLEQDINGRTTAVVQPWTDGRPLVELSPAEMAHVTGDMSDQEFSKMFAFEYLVHDGDRHEGNYLSNGKSLTLIDYGQGMTKSEHIYDTTPSSSNRMLSSLVQSRALAQSKSIDSLTLDPAGYESILGQKDSILSMMKDKLSEQQYTSLNNRFEALSRASRSGKMNLLEFTYATRRVGKKVGYGHRWS